MDEERIKRMARERMTALEPVMDAMHDEVTEAVDATLREYLLEQQAKGVELKLATLITGRALIVLGLTYAGVAMGLDAKPHAGYAEECLDKLKAERKKLRGDKFLQPPGE